MKLFQLVIIGLVIASNIHWQWTPNPYLAAIIGVGFSFGATSLLLWCVDWRRNARSRRRGIDQ